MTTAIEPEYVPTIQDIHDTFLDEITSLGGSVSGAYNDGKRLFARAVLPEDAEVRPGDAVTAGVAIRVTGPEIVVHPYVFRQVCSNGAIMAQSFQSRHLERTASSEVSVPKLAIVAALGDVRRAIGACATREAFSRAANQMRSATQVQADLELQLLSMLDRMPAGMAGQLLNQIIREFGADADRSAFGLLNAVTAVARETRDPEAAWRLEEFGGTMLARSYAESASSARWLETVGA
jgi:hypothetical protein